MTKRVINFMIDSGKALSGQITVTTAGTAVQGTDTVSNNGFFIRALSTNSGKVYVGTHT